MNIPHFPCYVVHLTPSSIGGEYLCLGEHWANCYSCAYITYKGSFGPYESRQFSLTPNSILVPRAVIDLLLQNKKQLTTADKTYLNASKLIHMYNQTNTQPDSLIGIKTENPQPNPNCPKCKGTGKKPVHLLTKTVYDPCDCLKEPKTKDPVTQDPNQNIFNALINAANAQIAANQVQPATTAAPTQIPLTTADQQYLDALRNSGVIITRGHAFRSFDNPQCCASFAHDSLKHLHNIVVITQFAAGTNAFLDSWKRINPSWPYSHLLIANPGHAALTYKWWREGCQSTKPFGLLTPEKTLLDAYKADPNEPRIGFDFQNYVTIYLYR